MMAAGALSGQRAAWPGALAVRPTVLGGTAVLGGAAGLAPFASLVSVQPLDKTGDPTPAWSIQVQIPPYIVAFTTFVPVMILLAARLGHAPWLSWAAVPGGIATGATLAAYLGRRAVVRLESQQVRILKVVADAAR